MSALAVLWRVWGSFLLLKISTTVYFGVYWIFSIDGINNLAATLYLAAPQFEVSNSQNRLSALEEGKVQMNFRNLDNFYCYLLRNIGWSLVWFFSISQPLFIWLRDLFRQSSCLFFLVLFFNFIVGMVNSRRNTICFSNGNFYVCYLWPLLVTVVFALKEYKIPSSKTYHFLFGSQKKIRFKVFWSAKWHSALNSWDLEDGDKVSDHARPAVNCSAWIDWRRSGWAKDRSTHACGWDLPRIEKKAHPGINSNQGTVCWLLTVDLSE